MESMNHPSAGQAIFQLYVEALSFVPGYLYMLDTAGNLLNCNNNLLKQLGMDTLNDSGVGAIYKRMLDKGFGNEQQLLQLKKDDIKTILAEKSHISDEPLPLWLHHEETRWYKISRLPLHSDGGKMEGLLVILTDITEQKHLQEQLVKLKKELQTNNRRMAEKFDFDPQEFESSKPPKVLLIEDNYLAQKAAKSVLMSCDCEVDIVINEKELRKVFVPGKYQLLFMDIGLEGTSGYMLAKEVRKMEQGTKYKVPIIALTGFDAEIVQSDCEYYQMEGAIHKPLTVEQARQIIQHYIKHIDVEVVGLRQKG